MLRLSEEALIVFVRTHGPGFRLAFESLAIRHEKEWLIERAELEQIAARFPRHAIGLGDVVAAVAQPIARAIDTVAGTNVAKCGGCAARQARLNAAVPDVLHPLKRPD